MNQWDPKIGNKDWNDSYTGRLGELTVDTSNMDLRLHDGSTPGGFVIAKLSNLNLRFQAKSQELDGFKNFEPQERGFVVRRGPASYLLREFTVNGQNLVVTNPDGYEGNVNFSLKPIIESEHEWLGQQLFQEVAEFASGINADVSGNLTGNSSGTHTGPVIGNVTGNLQGNSEGNHVGGIDVQGADIFFDDEQIQLEWLDGLLAFVQANGIPSGCIVDWAGLEEDIPAGWFLCNGLNGTPDLRNRFVVGAGTDGDYDVGDIGGLEEVNTTVTVALAGAHTHSLSGNVANSLTGASLTTVIERPENEQHQVDVIGSVTLNDPGHTHAQGGTADSGGAHIHTATATPTDNRPPYYALCKIMKG
jgi:microcystin-dependent protein